MHDRIFKHLLCLLLIPSAMFASSGESETIYAGEGVYKSTRPLWANAYAPNDEKHTFNNVNDLIPGDLFSIGKISTNSTILINGFLSNLETYENALQVGDRVMVRNERRWIQTLNLQTGNFMEEGIIEKVEPGSVIIRYYTNLPSGHVTYESRTYKVPKNAWIRLEGKAAKSEQAFKPGRHLRRYEARNQLIQTMDAGALKDTRTTLPSSKGWVRHGYLRGITGRETLFCEFQNGEWIDTFAQGSISDVDGYNLGPGATYAYARPGDWLVTSSRLVSADSAFNTTYGSYSPMDNGTTIGTIESVEDDHITVKTVTFEGEEKGLSENVKEVVVKIELNEGVEFHHNGIRNSRKEDALIVGHQVRILPALPNGSFNVREVEESRMVVKNAAVQPIFPTGRPAPLQFQNYPWQQEEVVEVTENELAELRVFLYTKGATTYQWHRNGVAIPGAKGTTEGYRILKISEYAEITDDGAKFTCVAKNAGGSVISLPIKLSVKRDKEPLGLAGFHVAGANTILITFNKKVTPGSTKHGAENPVNYSINQKVKVQKVTLTGNSQTVVLETSKLEPGQSYLVQVNNVEDTSAQPNRLPKSGVAAEVSYSVAFRYFRFTQIKKGSLNSRINEFRFKVGDQVYGKGAAVTGTAKNLEKLVDGDQRSYGQFDRDHYAIFDLGASTAIPPDKLEFDITTATRPILGYRFEASNDQQNWITLAEQSGQKLSGNIVVSLETQKLDPRQTLQARKTQTIKFPIPKTDEEQIQLAAKSSSGLDIQYQIIEGSGSLEGNLFTPTSTKGTYRLRATQPGNLNFYSARPVDRVLKME